MSVEANHGVFYPRYITIFIAHFRIPVMAFLTQERSDVGDLGEPGQPWSLEASKLDERVHLYVKIDRSQSAKYGLDIN